MSKNVCRECGWDHDSKMWPTVNRHHFQDTGRYLSCSKDDAPVSTDE